MYIYVEKSVHDAAHLDCELSISESIPENDELSQVVIHYNV